MLRYISQSHNYVARISMLGTVTGSVVALFSTIVEVLHACSDAQPEDIEFTTHRALIAD